MIYLIGGFEERHHRLLENDVDLDVLRELMNRSIQVHRGMDRAAAP